jgi:hypothetical protein
MYRDLLSAGLSGLWSVDTLIDAIGRSRAHREIMADSPLLSSRMARADAIRVWLEGNEMPWQGMPADERERTLRALSEEPTLPFFTLFEAFSEPAAGTHLGILGSTIIAETVFGELERNKLTAEQVPGDLHTRLESISDSFKGAHFKTMTTMSDVVSFVWSTLQERADRSLTVPSLI